MANQTNKSTQDNKEGKSMGQGSGASAKQAPENLQGNVGSPGSTADLGSAGSMAGGGRSNVATNESTDAFDAAKDTAKTLVDQAKSTAGTAYEAVADKANSTLEEKKASVAGGLSSVAESVRSMSTNLNQSPEQNPLADYTAKYADTAAHKLDQVARYFETNDLKGMARDVESFARRNPAIFLAGAFGLGMLAARFIKSTPRNLNAADFQTGIDHQLPSSGATTNRTNTGLGTTPGVM